jgi:SAM-dependent methyltransferase
MPSETFNFDRRAHLSEWMDEPCTYAEFRACLRDLVHVNRTVFSYRPTLMWLEQFAANRIEPLHIVDVGCGAGDMLRRIERWARRKKLRVRLTGIDRNPFAAKAAREFGHRETAVEWVTADVLSYEPRATVDLVISSLFAHHLPDREVIGFLKWMERVATRGWFVNDLRRGRIPYYAFKLLARGMRWHRFVQHDGPLSIRRSFSTEDWRAYVDAAGISTGAANIFTTWPGRLCVARTR